MKAKILSHKNLALFSIFSVLFQTINASIYHLEQSSSLQPPLILVQDQQIYQDISQGQRSWQYYQYIIDNNNQTQGSLNSFYLTIRVDAEGPYSDPDIFISSRNERPTSDADSQQQCVNIRCIKQCTYSMKVGFVPVQNIADGFRQKQRLDWRAVSIFQLAVPENSSDGQPTQSILFNVESQLNNIQPIQMFFSFSDDLSLMEEKEFGITSEQGQSIRFSQDDFGWCTGCSVFIIVSTNSPVNYIISFRSLSRRDSLQDQISYQSLFSQQQRECFTYVVSRAINDVIFSVRQQQGDIDVEINQRNIQLNQTTEMILVQSEISSDRVVIVRSQDRYRFSTPYPSILFMCINPLSDSSASFTANQQNQLGLFQAQDDTLYSFILDSKDFVTFRFTSLNLMRDQIIQVQLQNFGNSTIMQRMNYYVCPSTVADECSLSESQAFAQTSPLSFNNSVDQINQIRSGFINHTPDVCPIPSSCHYLIAISNPDQTGPQRVTFQLQMSNQDPINLSIFDQYQNMILQSSYQYFQIKVSPLQLQTLNVQTIWVNLTSNRGNANLFYSGLNQYPNQTNFEKRRHNLTPWKNIKIDVSDQDLNDKIFYVSVFGYSQAHYTLQIDAEYTNKFPQSQQTSDLVNSSVQIDNIPNNKNPDFVIDPIANPSMIVGNITNLTVFNGFIKEGQEYDFTFVSNMTDFIVYYKPPQDQSKRRNIIFAPQILNQQNTRVFTFNVSYGIYQWNNNSLGLTLTPSDWEYNEKCVFVIRMRAEFLNESISNQTTNITNSNDTNGSSTRKATNQANNRTLMKSQSDQKNQIVKNTNNSDNSTNQTVNNRTNIAIGPPLRNITLTLQVFSVIQTIDFVDYTITNTTYTGFANNSIVVFKTLLMDGNATYTYNLYNDIGYPFFMFKSGPLIFQDYDIHDDTTYDFASSVIETKETQKLEITRQMRENTNPRCRNGTYPLRGGNDNCTMYTAIQCESICIFNFTVTVLPRYSIDPPILIKSGQEIKNQNITNGKISYFFTPYMRNTLTDATLVMSKSYNDSYIIARLISNAYVPFTQWNYPTTTSFDIISRNPLSAFEIIDVTRAQFQSRCSATSSCALLVGIVPFLPGTNSSLIAQTNNIQYNLTFLGSDSNLQNCSVSTHKIENPAKLDFYWFIINNNVRPWKYLLTIATPRADQNADMYVLISDGSQPSEEYYNYEGTRLANDAIILSSDSSDFVNNRNAKILVSVGIKAYTKNTTYQIMNWGPSPFESAMFNFTDLRRSHYQTFNIPSRNQRPQFPYKVFRYFNFGSRDLQINVTAMDTQLYVLANVNPYELYEYNSYFTTPLIPQLSKVSPQYLIKGQTFSYRINKNINNSSLCTFCWIHLIVFQTNTNPNQGTNFGINVTEIPVDNIRQIFVGQPQSQLIILSGEMTMRKIQLDSKEQFILNVSSNNSIFTVHVSTEPDLNAANRIFSATGTQKDNTVIFRMKQTDQNFQIGQFYYISIFANRSLSNFTFRLDQRRTVQLLKPNYPMIDKMQTSEDFVKYYYFIPPKQPMNYSTTITVNMLTPGFMSSVYVLANTMNNMTMNYQALQFPSIYRNNLSKESYFSQGYQNQISLTFTSNYNNRTVMIQTLQEQNVTITQTTLQNVTTTFYNTTIKRNQTATILQNVTAQVNVIRNVTVMVPSIVFNQTYYTVAVYLNNFGLTDIQKAEFEISCSTQVLGKAPRLQQFQESLKQNEEENITNEIKQESISKQDYQKTIKLHSEQEFQRVQKKFLQIDEFLDIELEDILN